MSLSAFENNPKRTYEKRLVEQMGDFALAVKDNLGSIDSKVYLFYDAINFMRMSNPLKIIKYVKVFIFPFKIEILTESKKYFLEEDIIRKFDPALLKEVASEFGFEYNEEEIRARSDLYKQLFSNEEFYKKNGAWIWKYLQVIVKLYEKTL